MENTTSQVTTSALRTLILSPSPSPPSRQSYSDIGIDGSSSITTDRHDSHQVITASLAVSNKLFPPFLEALTRVRPSAELSSFAGYTSHTRLQIRTRYYSSDVPIWCDDLPVAKSDHNTATSQDELASWTTSMLSDEAAEVRGAIGAFIVLLPSSTTLGRRTTGVTAAYQTHIQYVSAVNQVREMLEDETGREVATLVVLAETGAPVDPGGVSDALAKSAEHLEEALLQDGVFGWEVVGWCANTGEHETLAVGRASELPRNEYGESVGIQRVLEVLEQIDWTVTPDTALGNGLDDMLDVDDSDASDPLDMESLRKLGITNDPSDEMQREMASLHISLEGTSGANSDSLHDGSAQVDSFATLLDHAMAAREAASDLHGEERERFARREVERIMKDIDI